MILPADYAVEPFVPGEHFPTYALHLAAYGHRDHVRADGAPYVLHPQQIGRNLRQLFSYPSLPERILGRVGVHPKQRGIHKEYGDIPLSDLLEGAAYLHDIPEDSQEFYIGEDLGKYALDELLEPAGMAGRLVIEILLGLTKYRSGEEKLELFIQRGHEMIDSIAEEVRQQDYGYTQEQAQAAEEEFSMLMQQVVAEDYISYIARLLEEHPNPFVNMGRALVKLYDHNHNSLTLAALRPRKQFRQVIKMLASGAPEYISEILVPNRLSFHYYKKMLFFYDPGRVRDIIKETYSGWQFAAVRHIVENNTDAYAYADRIIEVGQFIENLEKDIPLEVLIKELEREYGVRIAQENL